MEEIIKEGRTKEDALKAALAELGASEDQVDVEIISQPGGGIFGFLGSKNLKLRVKLKPGVVLKQDEPEPEPEPVDDYENIEEEEREPAPRPAAGKKPSGPPKPRGQYDLDNPEDQVRKFIEQVIDKLDIKCDVEVHEGEKEIFVDITGDDSGVVIGKFGQTLDSLQYLANVIVGKQYDNKKKIVIDVGDYRERREMSVRRLARSVARKVIKSRKSEALAPMSPQDRRTVHLALSNFRDVETTSEGSGPNRKVIISYKK